MQAADHDLKAICQGRQITDRILHITKILFLRQLYYGKFVEEKGGKKGRKSSFLTVCFRSPKKNFFSKSGK